MSKIHSTQKYLDNLIAQVSALVKKIEKGMPSVLKEIKLSFSQMPGEVKRLYTDVHALVNHAHTERVALVKAITKNNKITYVSMTMESIHKEIEHIEVDLNRISNKYVDNNLLQLAVSHFHKLNAAIKKMVTAIVNSSINILKKLDWIEEGKFKNHILGTKINEQKLVKKTKTGSY